MAKILLLEDSPTLSMLWRRLLLKEGFEVELRGSLQELRERALDSTLPSLVLFDLSLDSSQGREVTAWLRTRLPRVPVWLFSSLEPNEIQRRVELLHLEDGIPKSTPPLEVLSRIRSFLEAQNP